MEAIRSKFCRKDDDPKGSTGWVMHQYSTADLGLNTTAAICKIQFKASSAKINNKRQGDQTQMSINPTPHKKPRLEDKGSHSHSHDHDQTNGDCDGNDDDCDDIFYYAGYSNAMLEKEKENPSFSETQEEDCFGQLVADTNPNEDALGTSQTIIDYDGLPVIEPLDYLGSDQCNGGFDHQLMIPTGFEFDNFCTMHNLIFC
ncbi:hypothetical protein COLO4_34180 [Corchorus olitorius]|uniref:No apical meristem (NAM) protein n=1 Tax=Corchorus olitorius TaxID=93759 RepID=A0A1R3GNF0_9ROSI|nr:hypothetical protein COLO4_34180 [Corchorus olitorius]